MVAVDDGSFTRRHRYAPIVAVSVVAPGRVEDVRIDRIRVDGRDATARIADLVRSVAPYDGVRAVVLDGIAFGGFNLVDLAVLRRSVDRPVLAVTPHPPDLARIRAALRKYFPRDYRERWRRVRSAPLNRVAGPGGPLWTATAGVPRTLVAPLLAKIVSRGRWPEALGVAHRIGRALGGAPARANHYPFARRRPAGPVA